MSEQENKKLKPWSGPKVTKADLQRVGNADQEEWNEQVANPNEPVLSLKQRQKLMEDLLQRNSLPSNETLLSEGLAGFHNTLRANPELTTEEWLEMREAFGG